MSKSRLLLPILTALVLLPAVEVRAQLAVSGSSATSRTVGSSLTAKTGNLFASGTSTANKSGTAAQNTQQGVANKTTTGGEWMIQRAHDRGSFVGADSRDKTGFVGASQSLEETMGGLGTGVNSLLSTSRTRFGSTINLPLPARAKNSMYHARLVADFDYAAPTTADRSATLTRQLQATPALKLTSPVEVSVEGQLATLRGQVASERDRALAAQMLLFEPGISEVRNLLKVNPASSPDSESSPSAEPAPLP